MAQAKTSFSPETQFHDPKETAAALNGFYELDPPESPNFAKFLEMPNNGIFQVLPYSAYHHPLKKKPKSPAQKCQ